MKTSIVLRQLGDISLGDPFFDSLKADYPEFEEWFGKKSQSGAKAFVQYGDDGLLQAFLYLKVEEEPVLDVNPPLPAGKRLKVGTFKIDAHNTKLGERFIKKIVDAAVYLNVTEIYVTIFPKHMGLLKLLKRFGFTPIGTKGKEQVLLKSMCMMSGDQLADFPLIAPNKLPKVLVKHMAKVPY